ncbi:MAG: AbrB/MazE/SpoVT family DNA-binding domain-containing protein [Microthrixaceae bacterium]
MMVSVDRAGRVVIPKELRDRLGIHADTEFEIDSEGDVIRLAPVRRASRRVIEIDGWPVIERGDTAPITDADVQRWRDGDQR